MLKKKACIFNNLQDFNICMYSSTIHYVVLKEKKLEKQNKKRTPLKDSILGCHLHVCPPQKNELLKCGRKFLILQSQPLQVVILNESHP